MIADVPKGEHTSKRGPKEKPAEEKRSEDFVVKSTAANKARFLAAGGSTWAYNILLAALDVLPSPTSLPTQEDSNEQP